MKLIWALLFVAYSGVAYSTEQMSFQQELAIERLVSAVETNNYVEIDQQIRVLEQSGLKIEGDLLYYKALGLFGTGDDVWAGFFASRYLDYGREAKFYRDALELKGQASDNVDVNVLANSRIRYTRENLELAAEPSPSSTGKYKHLQDRSALELSVADNIYKNNGDGTISVYSVIQRTQEEVYDLIRVDWMACPVGTSYTPEADQPCSGTASKYSHAQLPAFWKTFTYAGHSDWNLPTKEIFYRDSIRVLSGVGDHPGTSFSRDYMEASGLLNVDTPPQAFLLNRRGGLVRDKESGEFVSKPAYSWAGSVRAVYDDVSHYCLPSLVTFRANVGTGEGGDVCYRPNEAPSMELVLMRGPFLVESNLSGKCRVRRDQFGFESFDVPEILNGFQVLARHASCELDSKPDQIFRYVDAKYLERRPLKTE
ncbi:hypothetical protein MPL1_12663 [Methylophaga lonarensis MPL]|uniref:Uncharacterized protein n=1 Tax=Methylophaga lonarensis MPL TaxID=1286106 RepID=M7NT84_9GAMM|nr:hypothetical protein [Methylophaga lonarensis]EMR11993.1 hypothetical protein MPL1_12663 [Methylophaga lonarensis MPL]